MNNNLTCDTERFVTMNKPKDLNQQIQEEFQYLLNKYKGIGDQDTLSEEDEKILDEVWGRTREASQELEDDEAQGDNS